MKKHSNIIILLGICLGILVSCTGNKASHEIQGDWYREHNDLKAFSVRGDSIYYQLTNDKERGFYYHFEVDTLMIYFSDNKKNKALLLDREENRLSFINLSGARRDTLILVRK